MKYIRDNIGLILCINILLFIVALIGILLDNQTQNTLEESKKRAVETTKIVCNGARDGLLDYKACYNIQTVTNTEYLCNTHNNCWVETK